MAGWRCLLAAALALAAEGSNTTAGKPHIVMVLVDDWGWNNAGYHRPGDREVQTPNVDKLVREGIELDRHYTYHYCSPSRSSLQSGRYAVHVAYGFDDPLLVNPADPVSGFNGIPRNMTGVAEKLRSAGYRTHMTGKWDAGMATWEHTPMGRGYETFFGYFHHANDYWTQRLSDSDFKPDICGNLIDLWNTTGPAYGKNGTAYEEEMFLENSLNVLKQHDPKEPLFLFHSFHLVHTPFQVPEEWERKFDFLKDREQRLYAAMTHYMDDVTGKLVDALKEKGMWENTLFLMMSDNGGPTYNLPGIGGGGASNQPLKGGKMSDWEGGVRVNAFVSGGAIPEAKRGTKNTDMMHMADWYSTFCAIAGVDPTDHKAAAASLPPVDGIDQSALLLGDAAAGTGRRTEIHHSARAITSGKWKLITGGLTPLEYKIDEQLIMGTDIIPFDDYKNGYDVEPDALRSPKFCGMGCLYDTAADPYETTELSEREPEVTQKLLLRLHELNRGLFVPKRGTPSAAACSHYKGFYGPFVDMPTFAGGKNHSASATTFVV